MRKSRACILASLGILVVCALSAAQAGALRQLTRTKVETFFGADYWVSLSDFAIDDAGTFVVTASTEDEGANPHNDPRLVGWTLPAGSRDEIVPFPVVLGSISVSDDGEWIAFVAAADPVGQNADRSMEAFLVSRDGTVIRQLTNRASFTAPNPRPVLSGSANRMLFVDTGDPFGTNPGGLAQLFIVDTDGATLRQLTSVTDAQASFCGYAIDDLARRVAFAHSGNLTGQNPDGKCQIFGIIPDGIHPPIQWTSGNVDHELPTLSGDGSRAAYIAGDDVYSIPYGTTTPTLLAAGWNPSITDDGLWVYYIGGERGTLLYKIPATGGAATQLTVDPPYVDEAKVSGSNTALVIAADGGALPGGSNPDESLELWVTDAGGNGALQLTQIDTRWWIDYGEYHDPDITPDGSRIAVIGPGNEVYRVNADGSELTRLSFPSVGETNAEHLSMAHDGDTIVFDSLLLSPPLQNAHIYALRNNGTELFQLAQFGVRPVLGKTSNLAVFQSADSTGRLLKVQVDAPASATQVVMDGDGSIKWHRLDYEAEWVVFNSYADPLGTNPDHTAEIFRVRTDGSGLQQLTNSGGASPDISADGSRVVFLSTMNPLGLNPDGNSEIFVIDLPTGTTQQLTFTTGDVWVGPALPRISGNGAYVFFPSLWPYFEHPSVLYRLEVATGRIERCDGMPYRPTGYLSQYYYTAGMAVDYSGDRVAFVGWLVNGTGQNGDGSDELFLADFAAPTRWEISSSQPTVLSWEPDPRGVRYDVLRGDLANVAAGPGGTVDLGPVVCLENDSTDPTTIGFEDPAVPAPGEGFFFLFRFTQGAPDGPGSWGRSTGGAERVPGPGACAD